MLISVLLPRGNDGEVREVSGLLGLAIRQCQRSDR